MKHEVILANGWRRFDLDVDPGFRMAQVPHPEPPFDLGDIMNGSVPLSRRLAVVRRVELREPITQQTFDVYAEGEIKDYDHGCIYQRAIKGREARMLALEQALDELCAAASHFLPPLPAIIGEQLAERRQSPAARLLGALETADELLVRRPTR